MLILAHRANRNGPDPARENSLPAVIECLQKGWGIEIDIRRTADGRFYIAHDAVQDPVGLDAEPYCDAIRRYATAPVAVNIKETGYEAALLEFLKRRGILYQVFLFDMELVEEHPGGTAAIYHSLNSRVSIAARVSDRDEPIERALSIPSADAIWVDEFDRLWLSEADVRMLKQQGKRVYAISPEIHDFPRTVAENRWTQFANWGVDGVCTDLGDDAERRLQQTDLRESKIKQ